MIKIKTGILTFNDVSLSKNETHKWRGYMGRKFQQYDLIHNHDGDKNKYKYRYPLIQFKVINEKPVMLAITQKAIEIFKTVMFQTDEIDIEGKTIPVYEKSFSVTTQDFGITTEPQKYRFINPWIALNQKNYTRYQNAKSNTEQNQILQNILQTSFFPLAKELGYWIEERVVCKSRLHSIPVNLKGRTLLGFLGSFEINLALPDYIGVGKSSSRGYGVVVGEKSLQEVGV